MNEYEVLDIALDYLNEDSSKKIIEEKDINFFGTKTKIEIRSYDNKINKQLLNKVDNILKTICNPSLYDYLYKINSNYFEGEINDDSYYDGKTIKSGKDLRDSIDITHRNTAIIISDKHNVIYFCGEYWPDEEHGFSIAFPKGNFVKHPQSSQVRKDYYDEHHNPKYTFLGQWSDCL